MLGTARLYFDATLALAMMATFGVIAGFLVAAATGDRTMAFLVTAAVFALTGVALTVRLWRITRKPRTVPDGDRE